MSEIGKTKVPALRTGSDAPRQVEVQIKIEPDVPRDRKNPVFSNHCVVMRSGTEEFLLDFVFLDMQEIQSAGEKKKGHQDKKGEPTVYKASSVVRIAVPSRAAELFATAILDTLHASTPKMTKND